MAAVDVVDGYVSALPGETRRLGHAEWGITVRAESAGGQPLDVGLRIADELLRAQAFALPAQAGIDPWILLHWNRQTRFVRMACTRSGDIWVHGDLPVSAVDERALDRLLGLLVEGALAVRGYASAVSDDGGAASAPS
jgi:Putative bacterial sensory transduction regulator